MSPQKASPLALPSFHDFENDLYLTWFPPVTETPPEPRPGSSLRIACLTGETLFQGLRYEARLLPLTPENWQRTLRFSRPDFLLVESTWFSATGHWHMALSSPGPERSALESMLGLAKNLGLPTVFWFTWDHAYHEHFKDVAALFDLVFCADPKEAELLQAKGLDAQVLLPAFQPAIFNPIREYGQHGAFNMNILYDGWADLLRYPHELCVLRKLHTRKFSIIESGSNITVKQFQRAPYELQECILGRVAPFSLPTVLKYSYIYLSLDPTRDTPTKQAWKTIQAAACRLPIVHKGKMPADDFRLGFVKERTRDTDFLQEIVRLGREFLYRERTAQLNWRRAHQEHTFALRLQSMCESLGINFDRNPRPMASMITPTVRPHLLDKTVNQFLSQTYPNKELIIVFNMDRNDPAFPHNAIPDRDDITLFSIPKDFHAGTCLNFGTQKARGKYCFRVDDDDYYGDNYLLDAILHLQCVDADLFGKVFSYVHFDDGDDVFMRRAKRLPPCRFRARDLDYNKAGIAGCSLGGKRTLLSEFRYPDDNASSADAVFSTTLRTTHPETLCLIMDRMNMVVERKTDLSQHTWQADNDPIRRNADSISNRIDDLMV